MTDERGDGTRVEADAIRGIRLKLARAQNQLDSIQTEMDAYWKRKPMLPIGEVNADATKHVVYLRVVEPPPVKWAVIFGEAIHNMRSALDHAVYQLTIAHPVKPST